MTPPFISAQINRSGPLDCVIHFRVLPYYAGSPDFDVAITGMEVDLAHADEPPLTSDERITLHNAFWDAGWDRVCTAANAWLAAEREDVAQDRADAARDDVGAAA